MSETDNFISNFNEKVQQLKQKIEERLKSETGFKTKVNDSLSGIKARLTELQKKKDQLKSLVDKASAINSETEKKIKEKCRLATP
jgi:hypothetical protein